MQRKWTLVILAVVLGRAVADDANWPEFRKPRGNGTAASTGLPVKWNEQKNVK